MKVRSNYSDANERTVDELRTLAQSLDMRDLSQLNLPEVEAVMHLMDEFAPAGDVKGVISTGRARLPRRLKLNTRHNVNFLLRQWDRVRDKAVYTTFFAGPARIIWGYQNLLKAAGVDLEESFPDGYWQFYVDYALREDTARHANETHGFDTILRRHNLELNKIDRITAWVMAAIHCLHQYDDLLQNEWRERVYTSALRPLVMEMGDEELREKFQRNKLYRQWERLRPYRRGNDVKSGQDYVTYRRQKFDDFLSHDLQTLPSDIRREWVNVVRKAKEDELRSYQQQMSILAYLKSGTHGEESVPIDLASAQIGIIYDGRYFLISACQPETTQPAEVTTVRAQIAAIVNEDWADVPRLKLDDIARTLRRDIPTLRQKLRPETRQELDLLRHVPILLNMNQHQQHYDELAVIRQAERGVGSHAMTIIDTGSTFVFDQSHIFFDGTWGAALAEIVTNEALAWGVYLHSLPPIHRTAPDPRPLRVVWSEQEQEAIQNTRRAMVEASAETDIVNLPSLLALRRIFKLRNDLIRLTVNDLLVLYRAVHAYRYEPDPYIVRRLEQLLADPQKAEAARVTLQAIEPNRATNPSVLIPVDASKQNPRDRLHPMSFQVPIHDLDLLNLHDNVVAALHIYRMAEGDREAEYNQFDKLQRTYLAALAGCGTVFARAKEIAELGESASVGTIRLLAKLPTPLQRLLDKIPSQFEVLNDIIKGREVFSNVGAVAPTSSLVRFLTAKDDNEDKILAWGILTDTEGIMRITLRDFRPHVSQLVAVGEAELAKRIIHDYLVTYASGLNDYVKDLRRITMASRETRMVSDVGILDVQQSR
ncbi:MAG: hypothetical protein KDD89_01000 [Anaerolineales bacterium]|nr:hypothetical protein [Anaerolineales bacterium]